MSLPVWLGEERKCSASICSRFSISISIRVISDTAVFIKSVLAGFFSAFRVAVEF